MINAERQIEYWRSSSVSDLDTANVLIENGKYNEGLFFCHLAVEKSLKALYVKRNNELAPKIHKLQYLSEKSNTELTEKQKDFFGVLMQFQTEGRYPEFYPPQTSKKVAINLLNETKSTVQWLMQQL